jgi:acetyl-CoA acetyltransferase family protein
MREVVIVDGIRTPIARAHKEKGWFRTIKSPDMLAALLNAIFERNPKVKPTDIDGFYVGCANQTMSQHGIARLTWLGCGLPNEIPAVAVEMQCASAMAAIHSVCNAIIAGMGDIYLVGGVEDMLHIPMGANIEFWPQIGKHYNPFELPMGMTAEKVAAKWNLTREEMDKFAYLSHMKACKAWSEGKFKNEVIPIEVTYEDGSKKVIDKDQGPRADTTLETMAQLKPAFLPPDKSRGVTAGNSSPLNQGAALLLVMERSKADKLGLSYHLRYKAGAIAGVDPTMMGIGPIPASQKAMKMAGLTANDIDVVEINEAFASQSIVCLKELGFPWEKANIWGGAIAIGHPLGCSGARITVTLNSIMKTDRKDAKYGLATLCVGFGQGAATIWERV